MRLNITASSRLGLVRKNNEDMVLVGDWFIRNGKMSAHEDTWAVDRFLLAVADGMGGHNSGEVASSDVLHNLQFFFSDLPVGLSISDFNETIYEWLTSINNIIDSKGQNEERFSGMGTTLVSLAYYGGEFFWMNCGDSRIYRLRDSEFLQLSVDDLERVPEGVRRKAGLTQFLGVPPDELEMEPHIVKCELKHGDTFLICSDGLTDMLSNLDICVILRQHISIKKCAQHLVEQALKNGGRDNTTVIVIRVD